jgi:hypothetical protein
MLNVDAPVTGVGPILFDPIPRESRVELPAGSFSAGPAQTFKVAALPSPSLRSVPLGRNPAVFALVQIHPDP